MRHRGHSILALLIAWLASAALIAGAPGLSHADPGAGVYPFSCSWESLTSDFAVRDQLPQSPVPVDQWYTTTAGGRYSNGGWGPAASVLPPPVIPQDSGCDVTTWQRERVLAVAMRYIDAPDNPLGLQYRHHHIPGWDPPTSTYSGGAEENPDTDAAPGPSAWDSGRGLDCSNFTAWVYNYALGIKFGGDVHKQYAGTAGPMGARIPALGPFQPGDLIFLHPNRNANDASHVVIYIDDQHIIDSRGNAQNVPGVQIRNRIGWYREAVLGAWQPIG
ncbi:NlpC/P60 family protein [Mycolicibacterium sp. CBM1]